MAGVKADMVYTDPPYGIDVRTDWNGLQKDLGATRVLKNHKKIQDDDKAFDPTFIIEKFKDVQEIFIWGGDYMAKYLPCDGSYVAWDKRATQDGGSVNVWFGDGN
ncbi:MAG: hypothetical protein EOO38_05330 [Cytophagaceae bacterium]|nr:MAG: hypothetical protein EOO38_05330 [Cytophagaceae bacterium]